MRMSMTTSQKLARFAETLKMGVIADRAGISRTLMSKYVRSGSVPACNKALAIARALGVSVDWLLDDTQDWPPIYERREQPQQHESPAA